MRCWPAGGLGGVWCKHRRQGRLTGKDSCLQQLCARGLWSKVVAGMTASVAAVVRCTKWRSSQQPGSSIQAGKSYQQLQLLLQRILGLQCSEGYAGDNPPQGGGCKRCWKEAQSQAPPPFCKPLSTYALQLIKFYNFLKSHWSAGHSNGDTQGGPQGPCAVRNAVKPAAGRQTCFLISH